MNPDYMVVANDELGVYSIHEVSDVGRATAVVMAEQKKGRKVRCSVSNTFNERPPNERRKVRIRTIITLKMLWRIRWFQRGAMFMGGPRSKSFGEPPGAGLEHHGRAVHPASRVARVRFHNTGSPVNVPLGAFFPDVCFREGGASSNGGQRGRSAQRDLG